MRWRHPVQAGGRVERLKGAVRRSLGQQLDQFGTADLGTRVDELTAENQSLQAQRDRTLAQVKALTVQLSEAQDDLAGARESLRRMIRTENVSS
ncbi:hypothetical protein [Streptomyces lydicus]|uniref:hypothetical protein n=1 Tax=Streptomyces lydicus TaxID=47763 RepID=UPI00101172E5|nr:hypothetical protein [Streptomyces lydicus]MCZ1012332.1 hypothetical protein [Streptomyces lydicus]